MKPKKTNKADLRNRRMLFLEIGLIVSFTVAIVAFSVGQAENFVEKLPPIAGPTAEDYKEIPRTEDKRPEIKPMAMQFHSEFLRIVPNHTVIDIDPIFPDPGVFVPVIPQVPEDTDPEDLPPVWIAEEMPLFQGGDLNTFRNWVLSQINYPRMAQETGIQGKVTLKFVIEKDGSLTSIEEITSPDRSLTEEAVRVLNMSPRWTPGKQRGKPVRVYYVIPVDYVLHN